MIVCGGGLRIFRHGGERRTGDADLEQVQHPLVVLGVRHLHRLPTWGGSDVAAVATTGKSLLESFGQDADDEVVGKSHHRAPSIVVSFEVRVDQHLSGLAASKDRLARITGGVVDRDGVGSGGEVQPPAERGVGLVD